RAGAPRRSPGAGSRAGRDGLSLRTTERSARGARVGPDTRTTGPAHRGHLGVVAGAGRRPGRGAGRAARRRSRGRRLVTKSLRVAATADLHLGEDSAGLFRPRLDDLCGAELLLVAGDLTRVGSPSEAAVVAEEIGGLPIPTVVVLGNHDVHGDK